MPTRAEAVAKNIFGGKDQTGGQQATGIYAKYRELLRDSPWRWLIILASIGYLLSPVGLIPDIIPVVGFIDDGVVACILVHEVVLMILDEVNKRKAKKANAGGLGEQTSPLLPGPGGQSQQQSKWKNNQSQNNALPPSRPPSRPSAVQGESMYWPSSKKPSQFGGPGASPINLTT